MFARAKEKRQRRFLTRLSLAYMQRQLLAAIAEGPIAVTITRIAPRPFDIDGAWASAKNVIDGVADTFGVKDNDPRLSWDVRQRRGKPKEYAVEVLIERKEAA